MDLSKAYLALASFPLIFEAGMLSKILSAESAFELTTFSAASISPCISVFLSQATNATK